MATRARQPWDLLLGWLAILVLAVLSPVVGIAVATGQAGWHAYRREWKLAAVTLLIVVIAVAGSYAAQVSVQSSGG